MIVGAHVMDMKHRKSDIRKSRAEYVHPPTVPLNLDAILQLRGDLLNATHESGCEVPAVHALTAYRFRSTVDQSLSPVASVTELPAVTDMLSPHLAYCYDIEVSNTPLPIAFLHHKLFHSSIVAGFEEQQHFFQSFTVMLLTGKNNRNDH